MRNATVVLAVLAVVALAAPVLGANVWTDGGTGHSWATPENWSAGHAPLATEATEVSASSALAAAEIGNGVVATTKGLWIGEGSGKTGRVNLSGTGMLTTDTAFGVQIGFAGANGALYQTGGTFNARSHLLVGKTGGTGLFYIEDGTCTIGRKLKSYSSGAGTIHVHGEKATITNNYNGSQAFHTESGSTLIFDVNAQASGAVKVTRINVADGSADLSGTLDMSFIGAAVSGYYPLVYAADGLTGGLTLKDEDKLSGGVGWTLDWGVEETNTLGATYVPEPATMVLLGLGGIGVLIRRKRR